jgi:hypothetical protein
MSENFLKENNDIDPKELQEILIGFLGSTYGEVAKFDNNIISANPTLSHKKHEFEKLAERVLSESIPQPKIQRPPPNHYPVQQHYAPVQHHPHDQNLLIDPNQMEFSFDNSITAITINEKLEDIQKKLKKLDKTIENVVSLLEKHEIKNKQ